MGQIYWEFSVDAFFSDFQRIRDLEDKTDIQKRQIKDLEEKVGSVMLWKHTDELCFENSDPVLSASCTCWWWSTVLSFQFLTLDADFNPKRHYIIKHVMVTVWALCVYIPINLHTCVRIYIFLYIYIQAISSMDCSHCFLTYLKILFLHVHAIFDIQLYDLSAHGVSWCDSYT